MSRIVDWFRRNNFEITWFLIGFLVADGFHNLGQGNYQGALIVWALAALNYFLNRR